MGMLPRPISRISGTDGILLRVLLTLAMGFTLRNDDTLMVFESPINHDCVRFGPRARASDSCYLVVWKTFRLPISETKDWKGAMRMA